MSLFCGFTKPDCSACQIFSCTLLSKRIKHGKHILRFCISLLCPSFHLLELDSFLRSAKPTID